MRRLHLLIFLFIFCPTAAPVLFAQQYTSGSIQRLELTSDAALYASRASDDAIEIEVDVQFTRHNGYVVGTNVFSLLLHLVDEEDVVVQTQTELIGERTTATVTPITYNYSLEPSAQLDVNKRYSIRAQLYRGGVGVFPSQSVHSAVETTSLQYYHFFNTQSTDDALNVLFDYDEAEWQRLFAIRTSDTQQSFQVDAIGNIYRYDGYNGAFAADDVEFVFTYELVDGATHEPVATVSNESRQTISVGRYYDLSGIKYPRSMLRYAFTIDVEPVEQLDSVNDDYYVRVIAAHVEVPGAEPVVVVAGAKLVASHRLLHFSGDLDFNGVATTFTEVSNTPTFSPGGLNYVNTTLQVTNSSGAVSGWEAYQFGEDELLSEVRLMADGSASVQMGEVALTGVEGIEFEDILKAAGDINFYYMSLKLTPSGPVAGEGLDGSPSTAFSLFLPAGVGYTKADILLNQRRLLDFIPMPGPVALDSSFNPTAPITVSPSGQAWLHQEGRPYGVEFDQIIFDPSLGELSVNPLAVVYDQADALAALESQIADLESPTMAVKPSNEQYYRFVTGVVGKVLIRADFAGRALVNSQLSLGVGQFTPHFPLSGEVKWMGGGDIYQVDSLIDPSMSELRGVEPVSLTYHQSCPDAFCGLGAPPVELLSWKPDDKVLSFTPDGGLSGVGQLTNEGLEWGYLETLASGDSLYAHRTGQFAAGQFLVAGHALMGVSELWNANAVTSRYDFDHSPSVLLLAGYNPANKKHERFGTIAYLYGFGDYPGFNFRVTDFADLNGYSRIGRPDSSIADFAFTPDVNAKYYVRPAGVSGVHEAQDGSFDPKMTIYGYPFNFDNYGLSFLDSENHESQTNGNLSVPKPTGFTQSFLELIMSCVGELEEAQLDPDDLGEKSLDYWNGAFEPKTIRFAAPEGDDSCNRTGDPILAMGVTTQVAHLDALLFGEMGFFPNGQIAAPEDGYPVTSRFQLPAQLELAGPSGEASYTMTPVSPLYFNDNAEGPSDRGFATFAATQDVSFFVDVLVQVITSADADSSVDFDMVGGWPDQGWQEAGASYFTLVDFDAGNIGWPTASAADVDSYDDYRRPSSAQPTAYTPVALQSFFGVLDFEYPLKWNTSSRFYRSYSAVNDDLMVLNIDHSVDYLSAEHIEVSFGAQYDGLPQLNVSNMLFTAAGENLGAGQAFVAGVQQEVVSSIAGGIDGVAEMLDDRIDAFYAELFDRIDHLVLDPLYDQLGSEYEAALAIAQNDGPDLFRDYRATYADPLLNQYVYDPAHPNDGLLLAQLDQLRGNLNAPFGIVQEVDQRLAKLEQTLVAITGTLYVTAQGIEIDLPDVAPQRIVPGILSKNEAGTRDVVANLVVALIGDLVEDPLGTVIAEQLTDGETAIQQQLDDLLAEAEPTIADIEKVVDDLRKEVSAIRDELAVAGEIHNAMIAILDEAEMEIKQVAIEVRAEADAFLDQLEAEYARIYPTEQLEQIPNPFEEYPREEVTALLRKKLVDEIGAAPFVKKIQYTLKQYLYDLNGTVESTIDNVFAEVNVIIRELISETVVELEKEINPMLSDLSDTVGSGQIDGVAHFRGDALTRLRLDGSFEWQVPEPLQFRGYMEYLQLDSDGPGNCGGDSGQKLTEVSMGALNIPLDWISPDMRADVGTKFSMLYNPDNPELPTVYPVGLGGEFKMTGGELDFETFVIFDLKAAAAFGLYENFIAAGAGMMIGNYEAFGGIFLGKACSADPILLIDPLAGEVLGDGEFLGAYAYGEAWIPISEAALGIPASCMFRVSAGIGAGVFYFVDGPVFGGRMLVGASGEALCAVSIRGDVSLVGVKDGGDFRFNGRGTLKGKAGPCPFCLKFSKTAKVKYDNKWSVDL